MKGKFGLEAKFDKASPENCFISEITLAELIINLKVLNICSSVSLISLKFSLGMDIGEVDLINVERFAKMVISLTEYRKELQQYVKNKMYEIAPNMSVLIGEQVNSYSGD